MSLLLAAAASTKEPPRTDPETLTTLRHVANMSGWQRSTSTAGPDGASVITRHTIVAPARALRLRWGHGSATPAPAGRAGIIVRGVVYWVTWSGQQYVTLPNLGYLTSDPLPDSIQVEAGEVIYTVWDAPAGSRYQSGLLGWDTDEQAIIPAAYQGAVPAMNRGSVSGAPQGIYGLTTDTAEAFVCLGDSILEIGWMRRAAETNGIAWSDLSEWAEGIPTSGTLSGRLGTTDPPLYTLGLSEYGTNARAQATSTVKASMLSQWKWLTSGPVERLGQTTMVPYVTSGGNYTTLDGQIATDAAWRDDINGWLRDGAPLTTDATAPAATGTSGALRAGDAGHPLVGICDIAAATEATNSRGEKVWRVDNGAATTDGVHPARVGSDFMEPVAAAWIAQHI